MWNTAPDKTYFPMSIARPRPAPLSAAIHEPTPPQIHRRQTARNPGRLSPRPTPTGVLARSTAVTSQAAALARIAESRASGASPTPPPRSRPRIVSEDATSSALECADDLATIRAACPPLTASGASPRRDIIDWRDRALPSQADELIRLDIIDWRMNGRRDRTLPSQATELARFQAEIRAACPPLTASGASSRRDIIGESDATGDRRTNGSRPRIVRRAPHDRARLSKAAGRLLPSQADELTRLIGESDATGDGFFTEGCRIQTHRRIVSEDMDARAAPKQRPTPRHRRSVSEHAIPPEDADRRVCCVCLDAPASHAFAPCGHYCLCGGRRCRAATGGRCPVCRAAYDAIIKIC